MLTFLHETVSIHELNINTYVCTDRFVSLNRSRNIYNLKQNEVYRFCRNSARTVDVARTTGSNNRDPNVSLGGDRHGGLVVKASAS